MRRALPVGGAALALVVLAGPVAGSAPSGAATGTPAVPSGADGARPVCALADPGLEEVSGLVVAGGRWWVHEDSGQGPSVHVLDDRCATVAVVRPLGVAVVDPEDLATGRDAVGRPVLWLADVGDNLARRQSVTLVRFPVPALPLSPVAGPGVPQVEVEAERFPLGYADGPRDAEALLVTPRGDVAVVTKPLVGAPGVYVPDAALEAGVPGVLRRVGDVRLGRVPAGQRGAAQGPAGPLSPLLVTGGSVFPDGSRVALRTYTHLHEWSVRADERGADGDPDLAVLLGRSPDVVVALPPTEQGEAVAHEADGTLLVTGEGVGAPVHRVVTPERPAASPGAGPGTSADSAGAAGAARPPAGRSPAGDPTGEEEPADGSGALLLAGPAVTLATATGAAVRWRRRRGPTARVARGRPR